MPGFIEAVHIAPTARAPMIKTDAVTLQPGCGIVGDRYGDGKGTFSDWPRDHELTLVEAEMIEAANAEYGLHLEAGATRRNLTTRGIRLNPLVGRRFRVGGVLCEGTRLCDPCAHLEVVTEIGGLARILADRAGLRARILEEGIVRKGDLIEEMVEE